MVYLTEKKGRRPVVLNNFVKKKKRKEECACEIPIPECICTNFSQKHFKSFRMSVALATLALYCMVLGYIIKSRMSDEHTNLFKFAQNFQHLSRRSEKEEIVQQRKILEASPATRVTKNESKEVLVQINTKQVKMSELKTTSPGRLITSISPPVLHKKAWSAFGAWMKDPASDDDAIYILDYYFRNQQVDMFNSAQDFADDVVARYYKLPVQWGGTGHAVYKGHLYFNRYNSSTLCKFDLKSGELVVSKNLPNAGYGNMSPYQWAGSTDIDFAVDSDGLWVIYATPQSEWNITISKLNHETLEVEKTWLTNYRKRSAANAFIVNGVLYTLHRYDTPSTMLNYAFDTKTSTYFWPKIPFQIKYGSMASLDYDFKENKLYAWDRGHQLTYDVSFK